MLRLTDGGVVCGWARLGRWFGRRIHAEFGAGVVGACRDGCCDVFAWRISKTSVDSRVEQEFLSSVSGANDAISNRMLDYNIALDSAVGLLRSSEAPITRTGWKTFADSLKLRTQFRGIQALGYAVIVSPDEKANFEGVRAQRAFQFRHQTDRRSRSLLGDPLHRTV